METTDTDIEAESTDSQFEPDRGRADSEVVGGLEENVAGALTYLLGAITGIVFYLLEEDNEFVRFHAVQSTIVFGGLIALSIGAMVVQIVLGAIPFVGWVAALVVGMLSLLLIPLGFVLWILLLVKAYSGERYGLPIVGGVAERYV